MKLWTIQPLSWYNTLLEKGVMTGDVSFIYPDFLFAYDWLVKQMIERLGDRPDGVSYPIWAWYQYLNENKKKPDLRCCGHGEKGKEYVLLEIEKKENEVVLSDYDLWHFPLGIRYYIGSTEDETLSFEAEMEELGYNSGLSDNLPILYQEKIIESWNKIFDMNFEDPYFSLPFSKKSIQATFWQLYLSEIVSVRYFVCR